MAGDEIDHEARRDILTHIKVCEERYGSLWMALNDIKAMLATHNAVTHERFTAISGRMWSLVVWACSMSIVGLAGVVFYLLTTRGKL